MFLNDVELKENLHALLNEYELRYSAAMHERWSREYSSYNFRIFVTKVSVVRLKPVLILCLK